MHELSIAHALMEQVDEHAPGGVSVHRVTVLAGAMQAIEPDAMQWAWDATVRGTRFDGAHLELQIEPFTLTCPDCGNQWESDQMYDTCPCGCERPTPTGSHAITLMALTVDDAKHQEPAG